MRPTRKKLPAPIAARLDKEMDVVWARSHLGEFSFGPKFDKALINTFGSQNHDYAVRTVIADGKHRVGSPEFQMAVLKWLRERELLDKRQNG
jgi:hypothetical protein